MHFECAWGAYKIDKMKYNINNKQTHPPSQPPDSPYSLASQSSTSKHSALASPQGEEADPFGHGGALCNLEGDDEMAAEHGEQQQNYKL